MRNTGRKRDMVRVFRRFFAGQAAAVNRLCVKCGITLTEFEIEEYEILCIDCWREERENAQTQAKRTD